MVLCGLVHDMSIPPGIALSCPNHHGCRNHSTQLRRRTLDTRNGAELQRCSMVRCPSTSRTQTSTILGWAGGHGSNWRGSQGMSHASSQRMAPVGASLAATKLTTSNKGVTFKITACGLRSRRCSAMICVLPSGNGGIKATGSY